MTITMYDAVPEEIANIPANPQAVAGYVDGAFAWSLADWDRFPHAEHMTITISATGRARCLDVETGDATSGQAPGWYHHHADRSHGTPVVYTNAANLANLLQAMQATGISRQSYLAWSAHFDAGEHICGPSTCGYPQADGTQWADTVAGQSCDQSILPGGWFDKAPARAHGIAKAELVFNLGNGHWHVSPRPGVAVHLGPDDRWASVEIQINESTGHWRHAPLPFNARPLGGR